MKRFVWDGPDSGNRYSLQLSDEDYEYALSHPNSLYERRVVYDFIADDFSLYPVSFLNCVITSGIELE